MKRYLWKFILFLGNLENLPAGKLDMQLYILLNENLHIVKRTGSLNKTDAEVQTSGKYREIRKCVYETPCPQPYACS